MEMRLELANTACQPTATAARSPGLDARFWFLSQFPHCILFKLSI
jgi:hypothetical protein